MLRGNNAKHQFTLRHESVAVYFISEHRIALGFIQCKQWIYLSDSTILYLGEQVVCVLT